MAAAVEYISVNSPVHRLNAVTKMLWALVILVCGLMFNDYRYLLALLASVLIMACAAGIIKNLLPVSVGLSVFALVLLLIQALFYDQGNVLFHIIPFYDKLPVTDYGLLTGVAMAARMMAIVLSFLVLLSSTRIQDLVFTMVEKLKVPYDYAFMFMTAMRFIPTFLGEVRQVSEAQQARGHAVEGFNPVKKIRSYAPVAVPLVLVSLNKAENLALAMETRGYSGGRRTYLKKPGVTGSDYIFGAVLLLLLTCGIAARVGGYGTM